MKRVIYILGIFLLSTSVYATVTLQSIQGNFEVTSDLQPGIVNRLAIEGNQVTLIESAAEGDLSCSGTCEVMDNMVVSNLRCENDTHWTQKIDFAGVDVAQDRFVAIVMSSLFAYMEIPMTFTRVQKV